MTPFPLETGHISVEEDSQEVWQKNYIESADFFNDAMPQVCTRRTWLDGASLY